MNTYVWNLSEYDDPSYIIATAGTVEAAQVLAINAVNNKAREYIEWVVSQEPDRVISAPGATVENLFVETMYDIPCEQCGKVGRAPWSAKPVGWLGLATKSPKTEGTFPNSDIRYVTGYRISYRTAIFCSEECLKAWEALNG